MTREEAIRIIEANCSCTDSTLMEACAMFIPELRESYDERVRKNIVATIEQCPDDFLSPKNRDRMLAYLEKLKEQKPQEPQVFCEAKAYDLGYKQGKEDAKKEQKPKTFNEPYNPDEYEVVMEGNATSLKRKEHKPKMTPKWLYRLEFRDSSCGLWYDGYGKWCFESGIGSISGCKTKTLPMDYDARYKQDGRDWFSSCSRKEDLMHWYSLEDAKELISKGFVFTRYLATEYHEYELQTVFIKETALYREEIDIFELFGQKPAEWSEEDKNMWTHLNGYLNGFSCSEDAIKQMADWFYELPNRLNPQPKQEWSEEDKDYYDTIVRKLEVIGDDSGLSNNQIKFLREHCPSHCSKWSEEDETIIEGACSALEIHGHHKLASKLKSLHPQPNPIVAVDAEKLLKILPQKQEWSEEDNEMFHCICDSLCYLRKLYETNEDKVSDYNAMIEWFRNRFKSLRPSWKPSEEQMKGLKFFLDFHRSQRNAGTTNWREYDAVESLYEQIKKL